MPSFQLNPAQRRILASIMGGVGMGIIGGTTEGIVGSIAQARLQRQLANLQQKRKKRKKVKHPAHRRRLKKHATAEDVARIFEDQGTDPEMPPLQPRNEGWRVVKEELTEEPGGMLMQKTTRVRSFGQLHKLAFVHGFMDELAKNGAEKGSQDLPSSAFYGVKKTGSEIDKVAFLKKLYNDYKIYQRNQAIKNVIRRIGHLAAAGAIGAGAHHLLVTRRKEQDKQAAEKLPVLIEPHLRKSSNDPFSALKNKLRIMAGRSGTVAGGPAAAAQQKPAVKETSG